MNWLDEYIRKNENGYLMDAEGKLYVDVGDDFIRGVNGIGDTSSIKEISKSEFIDRLLGFN